MRLLPGTAARVMLPPGAEIVPVLTVVPPSKVKFCPLATLKVPALTIAPGCAVSKAKLAGVPMRLA